MSNVVGPNKACVFKPDPDGIFTGEHEKGLCLGASFTQLLRA